MPHSRIPFERALDYANKEKITDVLYPLFVHNVEQFLQQSGYHPPQTIAQRGTTSREFGPGHVRNSSTLSQAPSMHSASSSISLAHPGSSHHIHGRPSIDRAHTLPTPPTTSHGVVPASGGSYDWANAAAQHVDHSTGLTVAKSLPTSPATTPPEHTSQQQQQQQQIQQQQYSLAQPTYDARMYSMQGQYGLATAHHGYGKTEMLPPPPRKLETTVVKEEGETVRPDSGYIVNGSETHEQRPYTYQHPGSAQSAHIHNVESNKRSISPENNTPRPSTAGTPQTHWQQKAYSTPHRISTDYRPMSAGSNMHSANHSYSASGTPQSYYQYANGVTPTHAPSTNKRLRDIEEEDEDGYSRPSSSHGGEYDGGLKRRKTVREGVENVVRPIATPSALSRSRSMNYQRR